MRIALVVGIIIAIIAVLFAVQNPGYTEIQVGNLTFRALTAVAFIIAFGVGAIVGMLFMLPSVMKHKRRARTLEKRVVEERPATVTEHRVVETAPPASERRSDTAL